MGRRLRQRRHRGAGDHPLLVGLRRDRRPGAARGPGKPRLPGGARLLPGGTGRGLSGGQERPLLHPNGKGREGLRQRGRRPGQAPCPVCGGIQLLPPVCGRQGLHFQGRPVPGRLRGRLLRRGLPVVRPRLRELPRQPAAGGREGGHGRPGDAHPLLRRRL